MKPSSSDIKNLGGRPRTGVGTPVMVRLQPDDLELLDLWIAANDAQMTRPEAMRRILRLVAMRVSVPSQNSEDWMASFDQPDEQHKSNDNAAGPNEAEG